MAMRISTTNDIEAALDALCEADPRLLAIRGRAGEVPLRLSAPGFRSLASIVVSQQVSRASAEAIFGRLTMLIDPLTPEAVLGQKELPSLNGVRHTYFCGSYFGYGFHEDAVRSGVAVANLLGITFP